MMTTDVPRSRTRWTSPSTACDCATPRAAVGSSMMISRLPNVAARATAIDRPAQIDDGPAIAGGDRLEDAAVGIEPERVGDFAPRPAEASGGARADQAGEFAGIEREAALGIHPPREAQRLLARIRRGIVEP